MKTLQPGEHLDGRYTIVKTLALGGFGQTYIATDTRRPGNPECVVKQLQPENWHPRLLETAERLFFTEAQTLERLGNHTQIPRLLAYFQEDTEFYLIQEFINGQTLSNELKLGESWPEDKIYQMLQSVLQVLAFIHENGVIHRDIKPDNVIRRYTDQALVLVDFGTVKQVRSQLTSQGQIAPTVAIGTPGYMPTEQSRGNPRHNSDIYALGMVGIQAATGLSLTQLQEDPDTGELIWQPWANVNPALCAILSQMVRYHFKDRYQSAVDVLEDLEQSGAITSIRISTLEEVSRSENADSSAAATVQPLSLQPPPSPPAAPDSALNNQFSQTRSNPDNKTTQKTVAQADIPQAQGLQAQAAPSKPTPPIQPSSRQNPSGQSPAAYSESTYLDPTKVVSPGPAAPANQAANQAANQTATGPNTAGQHVTVISSGQTASTLPPQSRHTESAKTGLVSLAQPIQMAALFGSGSWILAAALVSFLGTVWWVTGFWIAIVALVAFVVFAQTKPLREQLTLAAIALLSTGLSLLLIPNNIPMGGLLSSGLWGWLVVLILAIFAGALTFALLLIVAKTTTAA